MNRHFLLCLVLAFAVDISTITQGFGEELSVEQREALATKFVESRGHKLAPLQMFVPSAEELTQAMQAGGATGREPLEYAKGNGVRLLMTGHSWVAPAVNSLPRLTRAAGLDGHRQRAHISSGGTGSANSIWLAELGKFPGKPATPLLLPAIATGQWDVMSWGSFYGDTPECFTQWIDVCLKHNPAMTFLIQDGWPVYPLPTKFPTNEAMLQNIEAQHAMGLELTTDMYEKLNRLYPGKIRIVPASDAVVRALRHYFAGELPGFDCVSELSGGKHGIYRDGGHLSIASGFEQIVGYTYFGVLYGRSPEGVTTYQPANLEPAADRLLRQAAWKAVVECPMTGVTDKSNKGTAD